MTRRPSASARGGLGLMPAYFAAFCAVVAALAAMNGCVYRGAKVVEGTDLAVGLSIPGADGAADLTVFNYLSGFRLGVARDAEMSVRYTCAETNAWFGLCETRSAKTVDATVRPLPSTNSCERAAAD